MLATYMQRMGNNHLEVRIVGSSHRPQLKSQHIDEVFVHFDLSVALSVWT